MLVIIGLFMYKARTVSTSTSTDILTCTHVHINRWTVNYYLILLKFIALSINEDT